MLTCALAYSAHDLARILQHVDRDELVLIDDARRKIAEQKAELEQQIEAVDAEVRKIKGVV